MRSLLVVFGLALLGCGSQVEDDFYCGPGPNACSPDYDAGFDASLADVHVNEASGDANDADDASDASDGGSDATIDGDASDAADANDDGG